MENKLELSEGEREGTGKTGLGEKRVNYYRIV